MNIYVHGLKQTLYLSMNIRTAVGFLYRIDPTDVWEIEALKIDSTEPLSSKKMENVIEGAYLEAFNKT